MRGMKAKRTSRLGFPAYLSLAFILVILTLWNYIFNKLFDPLYGNFNTLSVYYLLGWILVFTVGFGVSLWYVDKKRGTIAKMFGQGEDLYRIHVKREGFELEVTGSSPQEVQALFDRQTKKDSKD